MKKSSLNTTNTIIVGILFCVMLLSMLLSDVYFPSEASAVFKFISWFSFGAFTAYLAVLGYNICKEILDEENSNEQ